MGPRRTGGHNDSVELVLLDHLAHSHLGILRARIEIGRNVLYIGQGLRIFGNRLYIDNAGDIDAAMADKYANARTLADYVELWRGFFFFHQAPASIRKEAS